MRSPRTTDRQGLDYWLPTPSLTEARQYEFGRLRLYQALCIVKHLCRLAGKRRAGQDVAPMLASLTMIYEAKPRPKGADGVSHPATGVSEPFRRFVAEALADRPRHPLRLLIDAAFAAGVEAT